MIALAHSTVPFQLKIVLGMQRALLHLPWIGSHLRQLIALISLAGTGTAVYLAVALSLWSHIQTGIVGLSVMAVFVAVCSILKSFFGLPRPHHVSKDVVLLDPTKETSYGFPSGHTVVVSGVYGSMALMHADEYPWLMAAVAFLTAAMMVSRVVSGAHFPLDVLGGLVIGVAGVVASQDPDWVTSRRLLFLGAVVTFVSCTSVRTKSGRVCVPLVQEGVYTAALLFALFLIHTTLHSDAGLAAIPPSQCELRHKLVALLPYIAVRPLEKLVSKADAQGNKALPSLLAGMSVSAATQLYTCLFVPYVLPGWF